MKKNLFLSLLAAVFAASAFGASTPKKEKYAITIKPTTKLQTKAVSLHKTTEGTNKLYVCYYAITVKKRTPYTVWISQMKGGNITVENVYAKSTSSWKESAPIALFNSVTCGVENRWTMTGKETWSFDWEDWGDDWDDWGDDWGDDDWDVDWKTTTPDTWTYYVKVVGDQGATGKLNYIQKREIPEGIKSNPKKITPKTKAQWVKTKVSSTLNANGLVFFDNHYYLQAKLKEGFRYHFGTADGKKTNQLTIEGLSKGAIGEYADWASTYSAASSFIPSKTQTANFTVDSTRGYVNGKSVTGRFRYSVDPQRKIGDHKVTKLPLGKKLTFKPGYLNNPKSKYFDMIVDEGLFKLKVSKKKHYVFETAGAATKLKMYLYDSKGNILATNTSKGSYSKDVRICVTPAKDATYYVGVCEDLPLVNPPKPTYRSIKITGYTVAKIAKSVKLSPVGVAAAERNPTRGDPAGSAKIQLGADNWYTTASFGGVSGMTYAFRVCFADSSKTEQNTLKVAIYRGSKKMKTLKVKPEEKFTYTATKHGMHSLRISPYTAEGLDYYPFRVHSIAYGAKGVDCGSLKVEVTGAPGKWTLDFDTGKTKNVKDKKTGKTKKVHVMETVKYDAGSTVALPVGKYRIDFTKVKNFIKPDAKSRTVKVGKVITVGDNYYNDRWDDKDHNPKYANAFALSSKKKTVKNHTLWKTDKYDYFTFAATKGYHYTFKLDAKGDQAFAIGQLDKKGKFVAMALDDNGSKELKSVSRLHLPVSKYAYYLRVQHTTDSNAGGAYTLNGYYEDLGVVEFVKGTVSVKDSATYVTLSARRTKNKGAMCVKYATVDGTAKKKVNFIAQTGNLVWKNGDKAEKKITIKLVPKTLPITSKDLEFTVKLTDAHVKVAKGVVARFPGNKGSVSATVNVLNDKNNFKNPKAAYASIYNDKKKTIKTTDTGTLRAGSFYGILAETSGTLTNGAPAFAAMTLNATAGDEPTNDTYTAKIQVAGRTYAFRNYEGVPNTNLLNVVRVQTDVATNVFTNTLSVAVTDGDLAYWYRAGATARLDLAYLPDAAGGQTNLVYEGTLARRNNKIQAYADKVFKFDGYYTVSLVPGEITATDGSAIIGAPEGHGYLTLSVDNIGGVKIAGLLADRTPIEASATACAVTRDASSATGYVMSVPVFQADATNCFATVLQLRAVPESGRVDGKAYKLVFDSTFPSYWNCDDGSRTYGGTNGWKTVLYPAGGWYDKLVNLQGYYNSVATMFDAGVTNFPAEMLDEGYSYAAIPFAAVDLAGNKMTAEKRVLASAGASLYDFTKSVNPCNVTVSFKRATGVSSGACSVWVSNGATQRQIGGFKHFGVLTIDRDDRAGVVRPLLDDTLISGSLFKSVYLGRGRYWNLSIPFEVFEH